MATGFRGVFIDPNILLYASNKFSPWHSKAARALVDARTLGVELFISSQVLREYLAVATRPLPGGIGLSLPDALDDFRSFRSQFKVLYEDAQVLKNLATLLQTHPASSRQIYDTNIVATLLANGLSHILTHNVADFVRFTPLITIVSLMPTEV